MARYRQIHKKIWKDDWFMELEPVNKLFYIYLFSSERATTAGIYELPKRVMMFESGLTSSEIDEAFALFDEANKAWYDDGVVFLPNLRKYHETDHDNCRKGILNDLKEVKECRLKAYYYEVYGVEGPHKGVARPLQGPDSLQNPLESKALTRPLQGGGKGPNNLNLNTNNNNNLKGLVVSALCTVCANAGSTDRKTLDAADDLIEAGRGVEWVTGFGEWYAKFGDGRPYLKHLQTFGGHYDRNEVPHFAKKNNGGGNFDALLPVIVAGQRAGLSLKDFVASAREAGVYDQWRALDMKWIDTKRLNEKQTAALRFRLSGVAQ